MRSASRFQRFLQVHPPDSALVPCTDAQIDPYRAHIPDELAEVWLRIGWGSFGQGLVRVVDPASIADGLALFLGASRPERIPIACTAFGEIFYFRDLREEARVRGMSGANRGELGDVSCVDVHYNGNIDVAALDVDELFDELLCDEVTIAGFLRGKLVGIARDMHGPLAERECFAFAPALALGGVDGDPTCVQKVDMHVHWSILRQLVETDSL